MGRRLRSQDPVLLIAAKRSGSPGPQHKPLSAVMPQLDIMNNYEQYLKYCISLMPRMSRMSRTAKTAKMSKMRRMARMARMAKMIQDSPSAISSTLNLNLSFLTQIQRSKTRKLTAIYAPHHGYGIINASST